MSPIPCKSELLHQLHNIQQHSTTLALLRRRHGCRRSTLQPPAASTVAADEDSEPLIPIPEADEFVVESKYCPQAVMDWYGYTGRESYRAKGKSNSSWHALSLKAKKHLRALGWTLWYANKKGKQEMRYKSPHNGKNYYSLRMACKACMEDEEGCEAKIPIQIPNYSSFPFITWGSRKPRTPRIPIDSLEFPILRLKIKRSRDVNTKEEEEEHKSKKKNKIILPDLNIPLEEDEENNGYHVILNHS